MEHEKSRRLIRFFCATIGKMTSAISFYGVHKLLWLFQHNAHFFEKSCRVLYALRQFPFAVDSICSDVFLKRNGEDSPSSGVKNLARSSRMADV